MKTLMPTMLLSIALSTSAFAQDALNTLRDIRVNQGPAAAITMAENLVQVAPRNAAYRFELGVIQAEQGNCRAAWRTFEDAMRLLPLDSVRRARDQAMADLCPSLSAWEGSFSLSIVADSNYNNATDNETIMVGGLPFELSEESRAQARYGIDIQANTAYNYQIGQGQYLVPALSTRLILLDEMDDSQITLTPSLSYRHQGERTNWRIGPALSYTFNQQGKETESVGVAGSWTYLVSANTTWQLSGSYWDVDSQNDTDDGTNTSIAMTWIHALENRNVVQLSLSRNQRERTLAQNSLTGLTATAAYKGTLTASMGFEVSASYTRTHAQGQNPFFGTTREDNAFGLSGAVSFSQMETALGRPYIGVSHTMNRSTIDLYDYDKTKLLIGLSRNF